MLGYRVEHAVRTGGTLATQPAPSCDRSKRTAPVATWVAPGRATETCRLRRSRGHPSWNCRRGKPRRCSSTRSCRPPGVEPGRPEWHPGMLPKHLGRSGASVRERSGTGGLEDRSAANYTSLAWSWLGSRTRGFGIRFATLRSDPWRCVAVTIRSHWRDKPAATPVASRSKVSLFGACSATCYAQSADEAGLTTGIGELSARVERASPLLRRQRARSAGESVGDVRVSIPSRMHSQCTGFASSLTSQWITPVTIRALPLFRRPLSPEQLAIRAVGEGLSTLGTTVNSRRSVPAHKPYEFTHGHE